jgi:hypothetical protein
LQDVFVQANARNIQSRQAPFANIEAFLTQSVIQTAQQGLNNIAQAAANEVAGVALADVALPPDKMVRLVRRFTEANKATQDSVVASLGV